MTRSPSNAQRSGLDQQGQRDVSPKQSHPRFRINDRVVVYSTKGVGIHGAVKWTEEVIYDGDKFIAVGIETVRHTMIALHTMTWCMYAHT